MDSNNNNDSNPDNKTTSTTTEAGTDSKPADDGPKPCLSCTTFFGTAATNFLCSSCFKKSKPTTPATVVRDTVSDQTAASEKGEDDVPEVGAGKEEKKQEEPPKPKQVSYT